MSLRLEFGLLLSHLAGIVDVVVLWSFLFNNLSHLILFLLRRNQIG